MVLSIMEFKLFNCGSSVVVVVGKLFASAQATMSLKFHVLQSRFVSATVHGATTWLLPLCSSDHKCSNFPKTTMTITDFSSMNGSVDQF